MAASNAQPFEINDFSKGITDDVFAQIPNASAELVNFLIGSDEKPISRYGSVIDDETNYQVPSGLRVGSLINYANSDKLFYQSVREIYYRNPSAFVALAGPSGNPVFSVGTLNSMPAYSQWNRHLYVTNDDFATPMKIFKDDAGLYQLRNSGLPALASDPVVTAGAVGENSYLYAFYFSVNYTVFKLTYETVGATTQVGVTGAEAPDVSPISITGIPVITNGLSDNFDTANIKIQIFRTTSGGTFFQKVGEVTNGVTSFVDSVSDNTLQNTGIPLYTNDGTVDFDPVPLHKYNHVVNNTGYYGFIKDGSEESPYTLRQSVPGVPDSGPIDFEASVDDEMTGISSVQSMPIVTCKKYIYRIDQAFDQFGRGAMVPIRISDNAGCISHASLTQAENGLFWLGNDGVYYTDGYQVLKVSDQINDRYKEILKNTTQKNRIIGKFFEKERLVIWAIQTNSANNDNDTFLVLDLKWGISEEMTMTTWNGTSFKPSALEIFNDEIYRGDPRGFTLRHAPNYSTDPKIDIYKSADEWTVETIIWRIRTIHYNFGGTFFRKYPTRVLLTAADAGNTTIQITAINDDGKAVRHCKPIRVRRDFIWRDDDFVWRITDFVWRGAGLIEQWRRLPAKPLRLSTLQLIITNGYSDITNSDTLGLATFSGVGNTITLDTPTLKWPVASEDYFISSENDGYVKEFLIVNRVSDTQIAINDPLNELPTGSLKWVIRGYKKGEPLHLLGFNVHWTNVSTSQGTYDSSAAATGENA